MAAHRNGLSRVVPLAAMAAAAALGQPALAAPPVSGQVDTPSGRQRGVDASVSCGAEGSDQRGGGQGD